RRRRTRTTWTSGASRRACTSASRGRTAPTTRALNPLSRRGSGGTRATARKCGGGCRGCTPSLSATTADPPTEALPHAAPIPVRRSSRRRGGGGRRASTLCGGRWIMTDANGPGVAGDPHDLSRFVQAQERVYQQALAEITRGSKQSHWMWYIFPQL